VSKLVAGIDLGGTFVKTAVVNGQGQIMAKSSRPSNASGGPNAVMDAMEEGVDAVLREARMSRKDLAAAGIGAPGPMNWQSGVVYSPPNLPGWKDIPLAQLMIDRLGVPVFVDNDANVACYGEFWRGAGRDVENMCCLTLGTGVGGGIVVFGKLLRGIDGTAAEIGHLCVMRGGRQCNCGAKGCLEQYGSVTGMLKTAIEGMQEGRKTLLTELCKGDTSRLTGKMVSDAAEAGDEYARWVIEETGRWLGIGIASLVNLLNPEKVVLTGGMIGAGEMLFKPIRETVNAQAFAVPAKRAQIVAADLGGDAGVVGSAGCALDRLKTGE
jgi:glucokinase